MPCTKQTSKKFTSRSLRKGPPYRAGDCKGLHRKGNDGVMRYSKADKNKVNRWYKETAAEHKKHSKGHKSKSHSKTGKKSKTHSSTKSKSRSKTGKKSKTHSSTKSKSRSKTGKSKTRKIKAHSKRKASKFNLCVKREFPKWRKEHPRIRHTTLFGQVSTACSEMLRKSKK